MKCDPLFSHDFLKVLLIRATNKNQTRVVKSFNFPIPLRHSNWTKMDTLAKIRPNKRQFWSMGKMCGFKHSYCGQTIMPLWNFAESIENSNFLSKTQKPNIETWFLFSFFSTASFQGVQFCWTACKRWFDSSCNFMTKVLQSQTFEHMINIYKEMGKNEHFFWKKA